MFSRALRTQHVYQFSKKSEESGFFEIENLHVISAGLLATAVTCVFLAHSLHFNKLK